MEMRTAVRQAWKAESLELGVKTAVGLRRSQDAASSKEKGKTAVEQVNLGVVRNYTLDIFQMFVAHSDRDVK